MPWLLAEDEALKRKLQGILVSDANAPDAGRPVTVRFRLPESELGEVTYPLIVLNHLGISRDPDREIRGFPIMLPYTPEGQQSPTLSEWPIPYNIEYQIVVYSRKAVHDILLTAALAQMDRIPARFGYLEIPQDGTIRRLDLLEGPTPEHMKDADGKRIFREVYRVQVSSELLPSQIEEAAQVLEVNTELVHQLDPYG